MSEEKDPQKCPSCGTLSQRQVSQTSFVLKGSGWYVTEYGKNSASTSSNDKYANQQVADNAKKTETNSDTSQTKSNTDTASKSSTESSVSSATSTSPKEKKTEKAAV